MKVWRSWSTLALGVSTTPTFVNYWTCGNYRRWPRPKLKLLSLSDVRHEETAPYTPYFHASIIENGRPRNYHNVIQIQKCVAGVCNNIRELCSRPRSSTKGGALTSGLRNTKGRRTRKRTRYSKPYSLPADCQLRSKLCNTLLKTA